MTSGAVSENVTSSWSSSSSSPSSRTQESTQSQHSMAVMEGNNSVTFSAADRMSWDDATWILTSSFIIFTMQSGFGLLESGCVGHRNEVNIMMKNVADVIFGGISYWMLGYGLSFGTEPGTNAFCGVGFFFLDPGALAERARFVSYLVFSFFNTFIYCFPAHWVWADSGWLNKLGVVDVAGDGPVHLVGGVSALIAAIMIKPRQGRFTRDDHHEMESPVGAILGLFILWWSWLAFSCGSTYGISGGKWKIATRAAMNTLMAANSGGIVAFTLSFLVHRKFYVRYVINGVLASLVAITASCGLTSVKESMAIGGIGALLSLLVDSLMTKVKVDDPVSAFAVHGAGGIWGLLAAGVFAHKDEVTQLFNDRHGLTTGGGFYLLGVQALEVTSISAWTALTSFLLLKVIDVILGLRVTPYEEKVGIDFTEHNIRYRPPLSVHHGPISTTPPSPPPPPRLPASPSSIIPGFYLDLGDVNDDDVFMTTRSRLVHSNGVLLHAFGEITLTSTDSNENGCGRQGRRLSDHRAELPGHLPAEGDNREVEKEDEENEGSSDGAHDGLGKEHAGSGREDLGMPPLELQEQQGGGESAREDLGMPPLELQEQQGGGESAREDDENHERTAPDQDTCDVMLCLGSCRRGESASSARAVPCPQLSVLEGFMRKAATT